MDTQAIKTLIQECLDKLTLEYESVSVEADDLHTLFVIQTPDSKKLIGNRGENLRAFNYIVKRIVEKKFEIERPNFLIDVNVYQQQRNDEIRKKATMLIERVRSFKSSSEMDDMNAYERMIVHSMVADDPEIETESIGEGRVKKLIIRYTENTSDGTVAPESNPIV